MGETFRTQGIGQSSEVVPGCSWSWQRLDRLVLACGYKSQLLFDSIFPPAHSKAKHFKKHEQKQTEEQGRRPYQVVHGLGNIRVIRSELVGIDF